MPYLPKRPGPYILLLLLIILGLLTYWMLKVLDDPAVQKAVQNRRDKKSQPAAPDPIPTLLPPKSGPESSVATDPVVLEMHDELTRQDTPPERELEIIQDLMSQHLRTMGGSSLGDNNDVTRALVGDTGNGIWLPRHSPRIRDGQLLDRWGSPYWFHPNTATQMEIRSAGPDKDLFTADDIILNGSPAGFGATPPAEEAAPEQ